MMRGFFLTALSVFTFSQAMAEARTVVFSVAEMSDKYTKGEVITTYAKDGVTLGFANGGGIAPKFYDTEIRFYASNTMDVTAAEGHVTKVTIDCSSSYALTSASASTGTINASVWSGDAATVCITNTSTKQARFKTVTVELDGEVDPNPNPGGGEEPETPETPDTPVVTPEGVNLLANADLDDWDAEGKLVAWTSSANNATITQTDDVYSGSYAAVMAASGSSNKRLATDVMTLAPGKYTFTFYALRDEAGTCQAGYVPVTNGATGSYKYGGYVDVQTDDWTLITYEFSLTEQTQLALVVMNPKSQGMLMVDHASLVKTPKDLSVNEEDANGTYFFNATTQPLDGMQCLLGAWDGDIYKVAAPIDAEKDYGYLGAVNALEQGGALRQANVARAFTLKATENGYYLVDAAGRYLCQNASYNSFMMTTNAPQSNGVWTLTVQTDGTMAIANASTGYTIQYSEGYGSYGCYAEAKGVKPALFVLKAQKAVPQMAFEQATIELETGDAFLAPLTVVTDLEGNELTGVPVVFKAVEGAEFVTVSNGSVGVNTSAPAHIVINASVEESEFFKAAEATYHVNIAAPNGIEVVNPDSVTLKTIYNLQGVKVDKMVKGNVYIINGKAHLYK